MTGVLIGLSIFGLVMTVLELEKISNKYVRV
jgi:hypothetical protein